MPGSWDPREVVTFDGGVLSTMHEVDWAPECDIYLMAASHCAPWDPGGNWEGPAPEDPWNPDTEFVIYPEEPYFLDGDSYYLAPIIVCRGTTDNAHRSTHVPGTINVVGRTVCSGPVPSLSVTVTLQRQSCWWIFCSWSTVATSAPAVSSGVRAQTNAATWCSSGWWRGRSLHSITYPPGYWPSTSSGSSFSQSSTRITC